MTFKEEILLQIGGDNRPLVRALNGARGIVSGFASSIAASFAGGITGAAIIMLSRRILNFAGNIKDSADALSISTDELQKFQYGAELSGLTAEKAAMGLEKLSQKIAEAKDESSSASKLFKALGISIYDSMGKEKSVIAIADELADAIKNAATATDKLYIAREIFGRSGGKFVTMMQEGAEGMKAFREEAEKTNKVLASDKISQLEDLGDKLSKAGRIGMVIGGNILARFVREIDFVSTFIAENIFNGTKKSINEMLLEAEKYANRFSRQQGHGASGSWGFDSDQSVEQKTKIVKLQDDLAALIESNQLKSQAAEERLTTLIQRRQEIQKSMSGMNIDSAEFAQKQIDLEKVRTQIIEARKTAEEKSTREKEKQVALEKRQTELLATQKEMQRDLATRKEDRYKWSMQDLLESPWQRNAFFNRSKRAAHMVDLLQNQAKVASGSGRFDIAGALQERADYITSMMGILKSNERAPFADLTKAINHNAELLAPIREDLATIKSGLLNE